MGADQLAEGESRADTEAPRKAQDGGSETPEHQNADSNLEWTGIT